MTPDEYCQQKAASSGSSFYYSFLFLPPVRRRAITAVYAYCREVDDVVDEVSDATDASLDGMEIDLRQNRFLDYAALRHYAHRVAGVVGEISAAIFGYREPQTLDYAAKLGLALQLINIIRDIGDDARRGRIYVPLDELQRFNVRASDLLTARYVDGFSALMRFQAQRARETYDEALQLLPPIDRKAQRPGLMMGAIYATLLAEIERADFQVLHQRIALTPLRKLWIAWRTWVFT